MDRNNSNIKKKIRYTYKQKSTVQNINKYNKKKFVLKANILSGFLKFFRISNVNHSICIMQISFINFSKNHCTYFIILKTINRTIQHKPYLYYYQEFSDNF